MNEAFARRHFSDRDPLGRFSRAETINDRELVLDIWFCDLWTAAALGRITWPPTRHHCSCA